MFLSPSWVSRAGPPCRAPPQLCTILFAERNQQATKQSPREVDANAGPEQLFWTWRPPVQEKQAAGSRLGLPWDKRTSSKVEAGERDQPIVPGAALRPRPCCCTFLPSLLLGKGRGPRASGSPRPGMLASLRVSFLLLRVRPPTRAQPQGLRGPLPGALFFMPFK